MRKLLLSFYVFYVSIITYFSLTPIEHKVTETIWDKASHFIAYMILFIISKIVFTNFNYLVCVIICLSYSFLMECIQSVIPGRIFDGFDMVANALGTALGIVIYFSAKKLRNIV